MYTDMSVQRYLAGLYKTHIILDNAKYMINYANKQSLGFISYFLCK